MKITVEKRIGQELEVKILCPEVDEKVENIISLINSVDQEIIVRNNGESIIIKRNELFYVDSVDKNTFVYTKDKVYECSLKLYELENQYDFFRASKSCVINVRHIKSLKTEINRKLRITLTNGEQIMVSRQYADELKMKLGVK